MSLQVQNKLKQKILKILRNEGFSLVDSKSQDLFEEYVVEFYIDLRFRVFSQVCHISSSKEETFKLLKEFVESEVDFLLSDSSALNYQLNEDKHFLDLKIKLLKLELEVYKKRIFLIKIFTINFLCILL